MLPTRSRPVAALITLVWLCTPVRADEEREDYASIYLDRGGNAYVWFVLAEEPPSVDAIAQVCQAMFGVEAAVDYTDASDEGGWWLGIEAGRTLERGAGLVTGEIRLEPWRDVASLLPAEEEPLAIRLYLDAAATMEARLDDMPCSVPAFPVWDGRQREIVLSADDLASSRSLALRYGFSSSDRTTAALRFALVLAIGLALVLVYRARVLAPSGADASWLRFWRFRRTFVVVVWAGWIFVLLSSGGIPFLAWSGDGDGFWLSTLVVMTTLAGPPFLTVVGGQVLLNDVLVRRFGRRMTRLDAVMQSVAGHLRLLFPLLLAVGAGLAYTRGSLALTVLFAVAAVVLIQVAMRVLVRSYGMGFYALTEGELRDRIFEIARESEIEVRQVLVGTSGKIRQVIAAVVHQGVLFLTDDIVRKLERREIDAIMAHELAHVKRKDLRKLRLFLVLVIVGPWAVLVMTDTITVFDPRGFAALLVWLVVAFAAKGAWSRRMERLADRGALELEPDPEALAKGLIRLTRANGIPMEWGWFERIFATHPSTRERVETLGQAAGFDHERIEALFELPEPTDLYEIPTVEAAGDVAFTFDFKRRAALKHEWLYRSTDALVPLGVASLAIALGIEGGALAAVLFGGAVLTFASVGPMTFLWWRSIHLSLARGIGARWTRAGLSPEDYGGVLVGLAPGSEPRLYEGFPAWDFGYLYVGEHGLDYRGEKTSFRLERSAVTAIARHPGIPSWRYRPIVRVSFHAEGDESERSFLLYPTVVEGGYRDGGFSRLLARFTGWPGAPTASPGPASARELPSDASIGAPAEIEITSEPPGIIANPAFLLRSVVEAFVAGVALALLAGFMQTAPWAVLYVPAVAIVVSVSDCVPHWRDRRRRVKRGDEPARA